MKLDDLSFQYYFFGSRDDNVILEFPIKIDF